MADLAKIRPNFETLKLVNSSFARYFGVTVASLNSGLPSHRPGFRNSSSEQLFASAMFLVGRISHVRQVNSTESIFDC